MTTSESFEKWVSDKPRYYTTSQMALMRNAYLAGAARERERVINIAKQFMCPDAETLDGKPGDCEDSHCKMVWEIIDAINRTGESK